MEMVVDAAICCMAWGSLLHVQVLWSLGFGCLFREIAVHSWACVLHDPVLE